MTAADPSYASDEALRRLRWRARRGLLENDILLARFLDRHGAALGQVHAEALARLLDLADGELLELLLGCRQPDGELDALSVRQVLACLRTGEAPVTARATDG